MKISVLIPTLGRSEELISTVKGLLRQSVLPDEIIVVDQNQPSIPEVDAFFTNQPLIKHVRNSQKGLCLNYNRALLEAQSDIVLFVDDDVVPGDNLIKEHLKQYQDDKVGGVAGRVTVPGEGPAHPSGQVGMYKPLSGNLITNFNYCRTRRLVDFAQGCNMSFRKNALLEVGGFDMGFEGNGYNFEPDVCLRVKANGYKVIFEPKASLVHLAAPSGGARQKNKAIHTHYFVRNGLRLFRRHSPGRLLPAYLLKLATYVTAKAAYNRNISILSHGFRGIYDGMAQDMKLKPTTKGT